MPALLSLALEPFLVLLCCPAGRAFVIACQGYISLLTGIRATNGDDAVMVQARNRVLSTGRYAPSARP